MERTEVNIPGSNVYIFYIDGNVKRYEDQKIKMEVTELNLKLYGKFFICKILEGKFVDLASEDYELMNKYIKFK